MQDLRDLFAYNAWANAKVFDLAVGLQPELLTLEAAGTLGTVASTLAHLARVEHVYLALIQGRPPDALEGRDTYLAHEVTWLAGDVRDVSAGYLRVLEAATPRSLARPLAIPWFDFAISAREGLLQVLTHSAQHRSQVLAWLAGRGVPTPDLDYVLLLREQRQEPPR